MIKINDTLRFILPMLYNSKRGLNNDFFLNQFFVGAFTSDYYRPEFDNASVIMLVYQYDNSIEYVEFEKRLLANTNIYDVYTYPEEDLYVYVIQIPDEFVNDYMQINSNLFSKLSPILKLNVYKMWSLVEDDTLAKVLNNDDTYEGESFEEQTFKLY